MYWLLQELNPHIKKLFNVPLKFNNLIDYDQSYTDNQGGQQILKDKNTIIESSYNFCTTIENQNLFNLSLNDSILDNSEKKQKKSRRALEETNLRIRSSKTIYRYCGIISDVLMLMLIIVSYGIAFNESEQLLKLNKPFLICGDIIITYIKENPSNHSWNDIFIYNEKENNLTSKIYGDDYVNFDNIHDEVILANFYYNFIYENNSAYFSSLDNNHILKGFNINEYTFLYRGENTTYKDIKVPITLNSLIQNERLALTLLSFIMIVLSFSGYYVSHLSKITISGFEKPFYRTQTFLYFLIESILFCLFPYPSLKSNSIHYGTLQNPSIPISTYFTIFVFFRLILFYKLLKFSKFNTESVYKKCLKYGVKFTYGLGFRLIKYDDPILSLIIFTTITIFTFGNSIRIVELYYLINSPKESMIWNNLFHSSWFVMTMILSISIDGAHPRATIGRILTYVLALIGFIVLSHIMTHWTFLSIFGYKEEKCYVMTSRMQTKERRENLYAETIYYCLSLAAEKRSRRSKHSAEIQRELIIYYRRTIWERIRMINENKAESKMQTYIPIKEILIDIIEKIESNLHNLNANVKFLNILNRQCNYFLDKQKRTLHNMKGEIIALNHLCRLIELNGHSFGKLKSFQKDILINEFGKDYYKKKSLYLFFQKMKSDEPNKGREKRRTNPNQFDDLCIESGRTELASKEMYPNYKREISDYDVSEEELYNHFVKLFLTSSAFARKSIVRYSRKSSKHITIKKDLFKFKPLSALNDNAIPKTMIRRCSQEHIPE